MSLQINNTMKGVEVLYVYLNNIYFTDIRGY